MTTPRSTRHRPRPAALAVLLALLMLLMQPLGLQHGLSHLATNGLPATASGPAGAAPDTAADDPDGHPHAAHACGLCLAHAALAFALPSALAFAIAPASRQAPARSIARAARAAPRRGPWARGPPAFLR